MGRRERALLGGLLTSVGGGMSKRSEIIAKDRAEEERERRNAVIARLKENRQFEQQSGLLASTQVDEKGNVVGIPRGAKGPGDVIDLGFKARPTATSSRGELTDAQRIAAAKSRYTTEDEYDGTVTDWPRVDAYLAAQGRPDLAAPRNISADTRIDKDSDEWLSAAEDAKKTAKEMERPLKFDTTVFKPFGGETQFIRDKTMEYYLVNKGLDASRAKPIVDLGGPIYPINRDGKPAESKTYKSAEEVGEAYRNGRISKAEAERILQEQFGI